MEPEKRIERWLIVLLRRTEIQVDGSKCGECYQF
jgi:hypothetical protein